MNKDEILAKSRAENKNRDIYEQEVIKQANKSAVLILLVLAVVFSVTQILVGRGINWGLWALVFSVNMTTCWAKYVKLQRKNELAKAIIYTILVVIMSGYHIYHLIVSSANL